MTSMRSLQGSSTYQLSGDAVSEALVQLWQDRHLCDVELQASDGTRLPAHRLFLAAGSGYFRALFTGPGSEMRDASSGLLDYPQYTHEQLQALLTVLYERRVKVSTGPCTMTSCSVAFCKGHMRSCQVV